MSARSTPHPVHPFLTYRPSQRPTREVAKKRPMHRQRHNQRPIRSVPVQMWARASPVLGQMCKGGAQPQPSPVADVAAGSHAVYDSAKTARRPARFSSSACTDPMAVQVRWDWAHPCPHLHLDLGPMGATPKARGGRQSGDMSKGHMASFRRGARLPFEGGAFSIQRRMP